jgi:hypothetical protein
VTALEVEAEPLAVGARACVSAGARPRQQPLHDLGAPGLRRERALRVHEQVEEVEQRQPSRPGGVPVDDAGEAPALDEQVPVPEVAVAEPTRQVADLVLDAAAELAQRLGGGETRERGDRLCVACRRRRLGRSWGVVTDRATRSVV